MSLVLTSPLLSGHAFSHGFSLRTGGVSAPPFDSLNLARTVGDDPASVAENSRRFAEALGVGPDALFEVNQVHGARVRVVGEGEKVHTVRESEADALVTGHGCGAVAIRTADCVPILLGATDTRHVAAVHAGWRGAVAGVVAAAVAALEQRGAAPASLVAAIGPHIRQEAFEVGVDVAEKIAAVAHGRDVVRRDRPKPHVDLATVVRAQLESCGLGPEAIDDVGGCTLSEPARFFSYRRDGQRSGRHLSAIVSER